MKTIWQKGWGALFVVILLFISWEASVRIFRVPNWLLPSPSQIVKEMVEGYHVYGEHLLPTLSLALSGLMVGCLIGIIIGIGLHIVPFLRQAFYPLLIISQNIPVIVLAPLLVIWFGFGMLPKNDCDYACLFFPDYRIFTGRVPAYRSRIMELYENGRGNEEATVLEIRMAASTPCLVFRIKNFCDV